MVEQTTKGVKVAVETYFKGVTVEHGRTLHVFAYTITIKNNGNSVVELNSRHWEILDALNAKEIVDGPGVVGEQPLLVPGDSHTYTSGCVLNSSIGSMWGYYNMIDAEDGTRFKAVIPTFQLCAGFVLN